NLRSYKDRKARKPKTSCARNSSFAILFDSPAVRWALPFGEVLLSSLSVSRKPRIRIVLRQNNRPDRAMPKKAQAAEKKARKTEPGPVALVEAPPVPEQTRLDNKSVATIFYEVADLMEINNDDSFRIRSYRRAAEAIEALPSPIAERVSEPKRLLEIP